MGINELKYYENNLRRKSRKIFKNTQNVWYTIDWEVSSYKEREEEEFVKDGGRTSFKCFASVLRNCLPSRTYALWEEIEVSKMKI